MWPNLQFPATSVSFTKKTLNGKLIFLCCGNNEFELPGRSNSVSDIQDYFKDILLIIL